MKIMFGHLMIHDANQLCIRFVFFSKESAIKQRYPHRLKIVAVHVYLGRQVHVGIFWRHIAFDDECAAAIAAGSW